MPKRLTALGSVFPLLAFSGRVGTRALGLAVEMSELPVEAPLLVGADALLDVFLAFGHHQVDQAGEFAGGRLDRNGGVHSGEPGPVLGADEGLAAGARPWPPCAGACPDGVDRLRCRAGEVLAAADPGSRRERKPEQKCWAEGKAEKSGPNSEAITSAVPGPTVGIAVRFDAHHLAQRRVWMPPCRGRCLRRLQSGWTRFRRSFRGQGSGAPPSGRSFGGARRSISAITRASQSSICWVRKS